VDEWVDELALDLFAAAFACVVGFAALGLAVVLLVPAPAPELAAGDCPSAAEAQAQISARAQPAPIHLRIVTRCCFGSKGKPHTSENQWPVFSDR
jgi:hypothetical protein